MRTDAGIDPTMVPAWLANFDRAGIADESALHHDGGFGVKKALFGTDTA
jgi:hypothetical protein